MYLLPTFGWKLTSAMRDGKHTITGNNKGHVPVLRERILDDDYSSKHRKTLSLCTCLRKVKEKLLSYLPALNTISNNNSITFLF